VDDVVGRTLDETSELFRPTLGEAEEERNEFIEPL
jgi:hypothetical protein